jgi:hypothetical protein
MARSRRTPAVLILPMLFERFRPPKPAPGGPDTVFPRGREQELVASCDVRRPHLHSRQLYKRALHWRYQQPRDHQVRTAGRILFSGLGGRKAPNSMDKISTAGVLRLRATSVVSRNKSVRRSAQDDDFVGVLKKNIPNKLALMRLASWAKFSRPRSTSSG